MVFPTYQANSFSLFNRDCKQLDTRVATQQRLYDTAWNRYQTSLQKYKSKKFASVYDEFLSAQPVLARLSRVNTIAVGTYRDLAKFPKCIVGQSIQFTNWAISVEKEFKAANAFTLKYKNPLGQYIDFQSSLKK